MFRRDLNALGMSRFVNNSRMITMKPKLKITICNSSTDVRAVTVLNIKRNPYDIIFHITRSIVY